MNNPWEDMPIEEVRDEVRYHRAEADRYRHIADGEDRRAADLEALADRREAAEKLASREREVQVTPCEDESIEAPLSPDDTTLASQNRER